MNTIQPTITSFVFSPFLSGNILSAAIAIIPRMMIGFIAGSVYELFKGKCKNLSIIISSLLGAMSNSILVLGGIYFIFGNQYASVIGKSLSALMPYFIGIITTQSILEAIIGTVDTTKGQDVATILTQILNEIEGIKGSLDDINDEIDGIKASILENHPVTEPDPNPDESGEEEPGTDPDVTPNE